MGREQKGESKFGVLSASLGDLLATVHNVEATNADAQRLCREEVGQFTGSVARAEASKSNAAVFHGIAAFVERYLHMVSEREPQQCACCVAHSC